jgi:very-short-patch-repair endonuclease
VKFRRQHPLEQYVLDFYCHEAKPVIEVDGGQHFEAKRTKKDAERTGVLEAAGLRVVRFTNLEVLRELDSVLEQIREETGRRLPSP